MDNNEDCPGSSEVSSKVNDEDWEGSYQDVVPGYETFDSYLQEAFDAIRAGIKAANNLPSGDNYKYYSCFPSFNNAKKIETDRLLSVMQHVLGTAGATSKIQHREMDEKFEVLLEANDLLLDRANVCMDEESGVKGNLDPNAEKNISKPMPNGSWNAQSSGSPKQTSSSKYTKLENKSIEKPQKQFRDKIDNSSSPWHPRIKDKPNSLKPLAIELVEDENGEHFTHPYEFELEKFAPPQHQLKKRTPITYKPLDDTPLIIIDKPGDIKILLKDLKRYKEIAIDLEHHSHRSFQGITCLMQLSTPDTDYIIDTLSLRAELHVLNEIFTDPKILKVFHGAESDIVWLQKDLSLYIVNMFDTYQAVSQLSMPYFSLAYLLRRFCDVHPNKKFQLADWRVRPLSDELLKYAREDVHYLLHIKDHLQNQLIDMANGQCNILEAVYQRSTEICKKTYIKPVWTDKSYLAMYRKSKKLFNNKQLHALQELYKWRDMTARENDDSIHYILPNHMLLSIAETLPREMQGILACCNPIPPLVRQHLLPLHKIVLKAREQPLIKTQLSDDLRQRLAQRVHAPDSDISTYCPHDIPSGAEPREGLPCLLDTSDFQNDTPSNTALEHIVTVFDSPVTSDNEETQETAVVSSKKSIFTFISPFERYKKVLPMVAQHEEEERERQRKEEEERLNKIKVEEEVRTVIFKKDTVDTMNSINRVREHFMQVAETVNPTPENSKPKGKKRKGKGKGKQQPLANRSGQQPPAKTPGQQLPAKIQGQQPTAKIPGQQPSAKIPGQQASAKMPGRKKRRKRNSSVNKSDGQQGNQKNNMTTPIPAIDRRILQGMKREREDDDSTYLEKRINDIKPLRKRAKGEKKANEKELAKKGMMPAKEFDYKSVDFSSFQGGSTNAPNQVQFKPDAKKKRNRGKKGKKSNTKINI